MLNESFYKTFECAVPHKCTAETDSSKKCAHCDIGYCYIACEPIILECKHHVCKECTEKIKTGSYTCKFCNGLLKSTGVPNPSSDFIIENSMGIISKELKEKYVTAMDLFKSKILM